MDLKCIQNESKINLIDRKRLKFSQNGQNSSLEGAKLPCPILIVINESVLFLRFHSGGICRCTRLTVMNGLLSDSRFPSVLFLLSRIFLRYPEMGEKTIYFGLNNK